MINMKVLNLLTESKDITTTLFPLNEDVYKNCFEQEFTDFLKCDGTTSEGRTAIAKYYNVLSDWEKFNHDCDFVQDYHNLLKLVKTKSPNNNVWISFVEGLHRHAAIIACLLCANFDIKTNALIPGSLELQHFVNAEVHHIDTIGNATLTPRQQLCTMISNQNASLLTTPMNVQVYIPSDINCDPHCLMEALRLQSELISTAKLNSAQLSLSLAISKYLGGLVKEDNQQRQKQRKSGNNKQPKFEHKHVIQEHMAEPSKYNAIVNKHEGDDSSLGFSPSIMCEEWRKFINNPSDPNARANYFNIVCPATTRKKTQNRPPYLLNFETIASNDTQYDKKTKNRTLDASQVNAHVLIPGISHAINTKLANNSKSKLGLVDSTRLKNMIDFVVKFYTMRKFPTLQLHAAYRHYFPEDTKETKFLQGLEGVYRIIPVALFLTTLYNASFLFDESKSKKNLLVTALDCFELDSTVANEVFMSTMSKSVIYHT